MSVEQQQTSQNTAVLLDRFNQLVSIANEKPAIFPRSSANVDAPKAIGACDTYEAPIGGIALSSAYSDDFIDTTEKGQPGSGGNLCFLATMREDDEACQPCCSCPCHVQTTLRTPPILQRFLGSAFIGYSALPMLAPACNEKHCKRRSSPSLRVEYYFPVSYLSRIFVAGMTINPFGYSQFVKMPRIRKFCSPLWKAVESQDLGRIQDLFTRRLASPFDVDPFGRSALLVSSLRGYTVVCWS